jgi:catechol 2,3-dioxygenase-like lactoylglutathione lyase family enzyme
MHRIKGIKETCIYIEEISLARDFYNGKLGFEIINEVEGKHIFFRVGSAVLLCFNPEDSKYKENPPPHFTYGPQHFAFEVQEQDYDASKEWIRGLGIPIIAEVNWPVGLESFYFHDPVGNVLEIVPEGVWD